ncbi:unnamed protein product, partial [Closterium sp. NIES-54]
VEELRADLMDVKQMYREQIDMLVDQVRRGMGCWYGMRKHDTVWHGVAWHGMDVKQMYREQIDMLVDQVSGGWDGKRWWDQHDTVWHGVET